MLIVRGVGVHLKGGRWRPFYSTAVYLSDGESRATGNKSSSVDPLLAGKHHTPIVEKLWQQRNQTHQHQQLHQHSSQQDARTPKDSQVSVIYKFSEDATLIDSYANPWGKIRTGRILEDLDALAGNVAANHCAGSTISPSGTPPLLVTATVDRIRVTGDADINQDMKISGQVIWVGKSSMEIKVSVTSHSSENQQEPSQPWLTSRFTFVARNPVTGEAVVVPPLRPESEEEKALFEERQRNYELNLEKRKARDTNSQAPLGLVSWPDEASLKLGQQLLLAARPLIDLPALAPGTSLLISTTKLSNALICHRQQRNTHGRIFGGFLMRRAFELAFSCAYLFAGTHPRFWEVDHVVFRRPVNVGDLLKLNAKVLYVSPSKKSGRPLLHIEVLAEVVKPEEKLSFVSNHFYFTFEKVEGGEAKLVLPSTLEEARTVVVRMKEDQDDDL